MTTFTSQETPFARLARLCQELEQTSSRLELARLVADFLQQLHPDEVAPAARLVLGQPFPPWDERALNLSWAGLMEVVSGLIRASPQERGEITRDAVDGGQVVEMLLEAARTVPVQPPPLTILDVQRAFEAIAETAGRGSRARKAELLRDLLLRATPVEAKYIAKNVLGEMRHGVSEGIMLEAIARAAGVKPALVRRANQRCGDPGEVAAIALRLGREGLEAVPVRVGRPLKPMLAQTADDVAAAFVAHKGELALEYKLDGARVQIHKRGDDVRMFSRHLSEVTTSLPEIVAQVRQGLRAEDAIVEGEVIAVDKAGRPLPFQHVMRRLRRVHDVGEAARQVPVALYLFDCLYRDGQSLLDEPYSRRWEALEEIAGSIARVERLLPATVAEGEAFARQAREAGHEGVMAKRLGSTYTPGVRGKAWFKIKHAITLDLVIVAADWGYGRRHGWLSNYHLAARDEETGEFWVVGKTFKGLTDAEFEAMTARLLALKQWERAGTVGVLPRVVVEVAFNEIQESPQYPSKLALRFARITRVRDDKGPDEADTIQTLRALFQEQFDVKARGR